MMVKVVIIDDEPKAIELLKGYIKKTSNFTCIATFRNSVDGLEYLQKNDVNLVLLDINMPKLSGISLARIISPVINIIFTTAYSEFAVESYELNALDYLLKPITFERFLKAISKSRNKSKPEIINTNKTKKYLSIKSGYTIHRLDMNDILYLEKDANYITYNTSEKKILARESVSEALNNLSHDFMQIHKSYIVCIDKIETIESNHIKIKQERIPIGKNFKDELIRRLSL